MSDDIKHKKDKEDEPLTEKILVELTLGTRDPVTEKEKKLQKEIDEIKRQGYIVDIPFDI
jgi:hypothetical protein